MADLSSSPMVSKTKRDAGAALSSKSPFFSRAYGGYTAGQQQFYLTHLGKLSGKTILDPMSGQGFLLANLAFEGATVWLGDINPTMCLMSSLRSPEMVQNRERLSNWFDEQLGRGSFSRKSRGAEYVDDWLPDNIKAELRQYRELFDLSGDPFRERETFSRMPLRKRFAAAIPLLAAREIACFRSSDNQTWIKPGGLQREPHITAPMKRAVASWLAFAAANADHYREGGQPGQLLTMRMDAAAGDFATSPKVNAIVTSPPYANRLDYTRMWGPESQVAASIWDASVSDIQSRQIGSNVVRGTDRFRNDEEALPSEIVKALRDIKGDEGYASEGYYYPFFRNYAVTLASSVKKLAGRVLRNGTLVFFVRDTVRKDILFPAGLLIEEVLQSEGYRLVGKERQIVKRHVGLRRRSAGSGLYGVGQQEWWLAFRKVR